MPARPPAPFVRPELPGTPPTRVAGARVLAGGRARPDIGPYFYEPTILADTSPAMLLYAEETFGPVVAVEFFDAAEHAVKRPTDTSYGLSAGILTSDTSRGFQLAQQIESGIVHFKHQSFVDEPQMPFGGVKASGYGRFGGRAAIAEFTDLRWITVEDPQQHYPFWGSLTGGPRFLRATVLRQSIVEGSADFIAEVERVLSVLDGCVVVVSAVEGVQPQTRILWRALQRLDVPTLLFVNKIDRVKRAEELIPFINRLSKQREFAAIVPVSARTGRNLPELLRVLREALADHLGRTRGVIADPEQIDKLTKINEAARHLLSVINDILDLSKIEAGKLLVVPHDFSPTALFDQVHSLIREDLSNKCLSFECDVGDLPPVVRGVEGIPQGNLDQYVFEADDPNWEKTVPASIPSEHRRTTVSCYSWPGIHPEASMLHYGQQLEPLMKVLLEKGYDDLSQQGDYFERALYRATLKAW